LDLTISDVDRSHDYPLVGSTHVLRENQQPLTPICEHCVSWPTVHRVVCTLLKRQVRSLVKNLTAVIHKERSQQGHAVRSANRGWLKLEAKVAKHEVSTIAS
jgi:hypothetical protein